MEGGDDDLASGEGEKQELVGPPPQVHHCAMSDRGRGMIRTCRKGHKSHGKEEANRG
jgi:hypothetical protein